MEHSTESFIGQQLAKMFGKDFLESYGFVDPSRGHFAGNLPENTVVVLRDHLPLSADLLPHNLLSVLVVCELKREYSEEQIQQMCRGELAKATIQSMQNEKNGPSFVLKSKLKNSPSSSFGSDKGVWAAALGDRVRFSVSQVDRKHRGKQQFLTLFTNHPGLEQELCDFATHKSEKPVENPYTVGQFVNSAQYKKAREFAVRNSCRAIAKLANALGFEIAQKVDSSANAVPIVGADRTITYERPQHAIPTGLSLFNHLDGFAYLKNKLEYKAVGIYNKCGAMSASIGTPVFPVNPFDGIAWVADIRAESYTGSTRYTPSTLNTTLPCGGLTKVTPQKEYDSDDQRYIRRCLSNIAGEALTENSAKLSRVYTTRQALCLSLQASLPRGSENVRQMWHVFSTV